MPTPDREIALLCDPGGAIVDVLHDPAAVAAAGQSLLELVSPPSRPKALSLIAAARAEPAEALLDFGGDPIQVHAAAAGDAVLVVGAPSPRAVENVCNTVAAGRPALGAAAALIVGASSPAAVTVGLWNEISRLNNDLATAQRDLARSNAHLRWLNDQKNQLLGMAAHDLRNPLAAILAYCQFVIEGGDLLTDDQMMMLERMRTNSEFMLRLIDDVLDLSAIENGTVYLSLSEFDAAAVVDEVVTICTPIAAKKSITLSVRCESAGPRVTADRAKLAQVLHNLVSNALKFSLPATEVLVTAASEGTNAVIEVRDQGQGIPPDDLEKLFKPFSRLSVKSTAGEKSSGLGLAIVKRMVEAHAGTISVSSTPGIGTTFRVAIPARRGEPAVAG